MGEPDRGIGGDLVAALAGAVAEGVVLGEIPPAGTVGYEFGEEPRRDRRSEPLVAIGQADPSLIRSKTSSRVWTNPKPQ